MILKTNYLLLLFVIYLPLFSAAQAENGISLQRSTLSSFGTSKTTNGIYISQTAGQPSGFTQEGKEGFRLHQGFEQALTFTNGSDIKTVRMVVYPNPNSGAFNVVTDLPRGVKYTLTVNDIQGKSLFSGQGEGGTDSFFELPYGVTPGTYPAVIQTADGLKAETKIVIL